MYRLKTFLYAQFTFYFNIHHKYKFKSELKSVLSLKERDSTNDNNNY